MRIRLEYEIELPDREHTDEELDAFLEFEFGFNGRLDGNNPFLDTKVEIDSGSLLWEKRGQ